MGESFKNEIAQVGITTITVPVGLTLAVYIPTDPAQSHLQLRVNQLGAGATLTAIGVTVGTTLAAGALATMPIAGYGLGASEVLSLKGHPAIYLAATGATCVVALLKGIGDTAAVIITPS